MFNIFTSFLQTTCKASWTIVNRFFSQGYILELRKLCKFYYLACSAGVFWVGEALFVFRNVVAAAIFDFMTVED